MANEIGGRADKSGNRFEYNCVINCFIDILKEKIISCEWEPIGDDQLITDIKVICHDKTMKYIQCKQRNLNNDNWSISNLTNKLLAKWKIHLDSNMKNIVVIQTPLSATSIVDLSQRAKNTNVRPKDFYNSQILVSLNIKKDYEKFCNGIGIELVTDSDELDEKEIMRSINYLRRIEVKTTPDLNFYEELLEKIENLFTGDPKVIYSNFLNLLINGNIWAKRIDLVYLYNFFSDNGIILKDLKNDNQTKPRIDRLNDEFKSDFCFINDNIVNREEIEKCLYEIELGNSIILHGSAGMGKSSCIKGLTDKLDEKDIMYLAIKLDVKIPKNSELQWSKEILDLKYSLTLCLDKLYPLQRVVLILDQLDSLRWTKNHSRDSMLVCQEIIESIEKINLDRGDNPISIIFTCRTFDLENDNIIKKLFETDNNKIEWKKIKIDRLSKEIVKDIIGSEYDNLNRELKELLEIPNNLFIWSNLKNKQNADIAYTGNLISKWWNEIINTTGKDINKNDLINFKDELVSKLITQQRININVKRLNGDSKTLEYLISEKFLLRDNNGFVGFYHQSILDYFTIQGMFDKYTSGIPIVELLGDKENQLPSKRFQLQLLLEEVQSCESSEKFIKIIDEILNSEGIRSYIKYVCYEVLGQIIDVTGDIMEYLLKNLNNSILNTVFLSHKEYIKKLITEGVFDEWIADSNKKELVFRLLRSINIIFSDIEINFIKRYINVNKEMDKKIYGILGYDVMTENPEIFKIRFGLIKKYPELFDIHIDYKKSLQQDEKRFIELLIYLCEKELDSERTTRNIYNVEQRKSYKEIPLLGDIKVVSSLIKFVPKIDEHNFNYYSWIKTTTIEPSLKRIIINIIKKANYNLIGLNPEMFFEIYKDYLNNGYILHNEIILEAFLEFPDEYSNQILLYLFNDIDNNIFEKTSGREQEISLVKEIIKKFILNLNNEQYSVIETLILKYKPNDMLEKYKRIQELRKEYGYGDCYFSHYGDLQLELLNVIPENILSEKAKKELEVLNRKFHNGKTSKFDNNYMKSGSVVSAISNKNLSDKQWSKIMTDKSNKNRKWHRYNNGTFISSEISDLASSFSQEIHKNPERAINLVLNNIKDIREEFLNAFFSSLAYNENINSISIEKLEKVFYNISTNIIDKYLVKICRIVANYPDSNWSEKTIKLVKRTYVIIKSSKVQNERLISDDEKNKNDLVMRTLNSGIGDFSEAVARLLSSKVEMFEEFEDIIIEMNKVNDEIINFATLNMLRPCLNIEKDLAITNVISWCYNNSMNLSHYDIRNVLIWCYQNSDDSKEKIKNIINTNIDNSNILIKKHMSWLLIDLYILNNEEFELIENISEDENIQKYMVEMLVAYCKKIEYKNKAKYLITKILQKNEVSHNSLSRFFNDKFIDLNEDYELLLEMVSIKDSNEILHSFINYIEKSTQDIIVFKDLIFEICENILENEKLMDHMDEYYIEKLVNIIINLFDQVVNNERYNDVKIKCLDVWDKMFEKGIGNIRGISREIASK